MNLVKPKNGFEPVLHTKVLDSYHRADIPTALPGKRDAKKKRKRPTFRSEFWMIIFEQSAPKIHHWKQWFEKFVTKFARMRPS